MSQPKPILVLGVNRSGTKWLCNEIARHPDVAMVGHEDHGGVIESNLLADYGRSFDFGDGNGYRSFLDFWVTTDFFYVAGGRREDFEAPNSVPEGPIEAFRSLMDDFAARKRASFWVQKVPPLQTASVLARIDDASLVLIQRDINDIVRSRLKLDWNRGMQTTAFRAALSIAIQARELDRVCRRRKTFRVSYERLKTDRETMLSELFRFLDLPEGELKATVYSKNTSFASESDRATVFAKRDLAAIRTAKLVARVIPHRVLRSFRDRFTKAISQPLPGTFSFRDGQSRTPYLPS